MGTHRDKDIIQRWGHRETVTFRGRDIIQRWGHRETGAFRDRDIIQIGTQKDRVI